MSPHVPKRKLLIDNQRNNKSYRLAINCPSKASSPSTCTNTSASSFAAPSMNATHPLALHHRIAKYPALDIKIPTQGVPNQLDRAAKNRGKKPNSAVPKSWYEPLLN